MDYLVNAQFFCQEIPWSLTPLPQATEYQVIDVCDRFSSKLRTTSMTGESTESETNAGGQPSGQYNRESRTISGELKNSRKLLAGALWPSFR